MDYEQLVAGNLLFRMLDEKARHEVSKLAQLRTYQAGETIIAQDATEAEIFLLRKGQVSVSKSHQGTQIELNKLGPGVIFGEMAEAQGVRRTASVTALQDVEVVVFPGFQLVEQLRHHKTASKLLEHIVLRRIKDQQSKLTPSD